MNVNVCVIIFTLLYHGPLNPTTLVSVL